MQKYINQLLWEKNRDSLIDTLEIGGDKIQSIINRIEEKEKRIDFLKKRERLKN